MTVDFKQRLLFKETFKEIFQMVDHHIEFCPAKDYDCSYSCLNCKARLGKLICKSMDKCLEMID